MNLNNPKFHLEYGNWDDHLNYRIHSTSQIVT
jgi:hypothetical protein